MAKLMQYDINPYIINWIAAFLSNKQQLASQARKRLLLRMEFGSYRGSSRDHIGPLAVSCYA